MKVNFIFQGGWTKEFTDVDDFGVAALRRALADPHKRWFQIGEKENDAESTYVALFNVMVVEFIPESIPEQS